MLAPSGHCLDATERRWANLRAKMYEMVVKNETHSEAARAKLSPGHVKRPCAPIRPGSKMRPGPIETPVIRIAHARQPSAFLIKITNGRATSQPGSAKRK